MCHFWDVLYYLTTCLVMKNGVIIQYSLYLNIQILYHINFKGYYLRSYQKYFCGNVYTTLAIILDLDNIILLVSLVPLNPVHPILFCPFALVPCLFLPSPPVSVPFMFQSGTVQLMFHFYIDPDGRYDVSRTITQERLSCPVDCEMSLKKWSKFYKIMRMTYQTDQLQFVLFVAPVAG